MDNVPEASTSKDRTEKTSAFLRKAEGVLKSILVNISSQAVKALAKHCIENVDISSFFN